MSFTETDEQRALRKAAAELGSRYGFAYTRSKVASGEWLGALLVIARVGRVAPISREMILNFVAQTTLGLPRSY